MTTTEIITTNHGGIGVAGWQLNFYPATQDGSDCQRPEGI